MPLTAMWLTCKSKTSKRATLYIPTVSSVYTMNLVNLQPLQKPTDMMSSRFIGSIKSQARFVHTKMNDQMKLYKQEPLFFRFNGSFLWNSDAILVVC